MTTTRELGQRLEDLGRRLRDLDLPDQTVERIDAQLDRLDELVAETRPRTRGVMNWWGVGKEFWRKMDVDDYIRKERDSWR
jgi:hypothetical protein